MIPAAIFDETMSLGATQVSAVSSRHNIGKYTEIGPVASFSSIGASSNVPASFDSFFKDKELSAMPEASGRASVQKSMALDKPQEKAKTQAHLRRIETNKDHLKKTKGTGDTERVHFEEKTSAQTLDVSSALYKDNSDIAPSLVTAPAGFTNPIPPSPMEQQSVRLAAFQLEDRPSSNPANSEDGSPILGGDTRTLIAPPYMAEEATSPLGSV